MKEKKSKINLTWEKLPLNKKFSLVILGVLVIPVLLSVYLLLNTLRQEDIHHLIEAIEGDLGGIKTFVSSNSAMATAVISMVESNPQLTEALNTPFTVGELMTFHQDVTPYFETIAVASPNMRALRIYSDANQMPERYPVFLDVKRVENEQWFRESSRNYPQKRMNYGENLSNHISQYRGESLVSFYQSLETFGETPAVVEVSFHASDFFGEVFTGKENGTCFIVYEDVIFLANPSDLEEEQLIFCEEFIVEQGENALEKPVQKSNGHTYVMLGNYCPDTNITYYIISDLTLRVSETLNTQLFFVGLLFLFFIMFAFILENIAKMLLSRIYQTVAAMRELELGNTSVQIQNPTSDEFGQLQGYFNQMVVQIDTLIKQESSRALLEKDAELKALQNQINAHFLYNVLNNIEMMAIVDENYLIADTVTALARLLRYSMKWDRQMVPLQQELDYVRDYIQLFNMRFDNEISLICDISDEATMALIPKMSVQPVVENAIIHGIEHLVSDEIIRIATTVENGILTIGITDTGAGMTEVQLDKLRDSLLRNDSEERMVTGIGLYNVHERILTRFGDLFGIKIQSKLNEYTKVTIELPYSLQEK